MLGNAFKDEDEQELLKELDELTDVMQQIPEAPKDALPEITEPIDNQETIRKVTEKKASTRQALLA